MSVDASINLRIVYASSRKVVSPTQTLEILISNGWNIVSRDGYVFYKLPQANEDLSDWEINKMDLSSLMKIFKQKEQAGELIGVRALWQETLIGGEVLLWQQEEMLKKGIHTSMSFLLTSERKLLIADNNSKITDVNWYLTKLLPIFNQGDTLVEYFTYEEHI